MANTGRAAVFFGPGKPHELRELPLPEVEPGAILVRIRRAMVCGSDLHWWRGDQELTQPPAGTGWVSGHEMMGEVHTLGQGVTRDARGQPLKPGDRIVYSYFYPCGRCYVCLKGLPGACPHRSKPITERTVEQWPYFTGAFAEYFYLRPNHFVYKVPDELSDDVVAPVNCALSQVIQGLMQGGFSFGDRFVVQGCGGLGLYATAVAKQMGASMVIAVDQVPGRLELARGFGADHTINLREFPTAEARVQRVMELSNNQGVDMVGEFTGSAAVVNEGIDMLRPGGTYLEVGNITRGPTAAIDPSKLVFGNKRICGIMHYNPSVIGWALEFLRQNQHRLPLDRIVSHHFPLERIDEAFAQAEWANRAEQAGITRAAIVP